MQTEQRGILPRIIEYSDPLAKTHRSVDTLIRRDKRKNDYGRIVEWTLSERTPGYTPAGSCMRWQENMVYRVTCIIDGATHGQAFLTVEEAEAWIEKRGELVSQG